MRANTFNETVLAIIIFLGVSSLPLLAATITVTNTNDAGAGSLRQAIADASSDDVIEFSVTDTITLSTTLIISKNLTINGSGASQLSISGGNSVRVIYISGSHTVNINNISIINGYSSTYGGGIENEGTLTIDNCIFSGNYAAGGGNGYGGAVDNYNGSVTITNSTFSNNTAASRGGAVATYGGTSISIDNSTFDSNTSALGGAISQAQSSAVNLTITNSTIYNNAASLGGKCGGAIYWQQGAVNISNSTISGNEADNGGAFCNGTQSLTININSCTIVNNNAIVQGGGFELQSSTANIKNTILAANTSPSGANFYNSGSGSLNSQGYNLCDATLSAFTGTGDITNGTLNIDTLADNGGNTKTHALLTGSDAINAIPDGGNSYNGVYATDQRGNTRPHGTNADIGAFELITAPTSQATDVSFSNLAATSATISWTRPASNGGEKCIVFIKESGSGNSTPVDGDTYTADVNYASGTQIGTTGWYCIYSGTSITVNITGISNGTTYRVHVCEYNGISGCEVYNKNSGSSGNPDEQVLPVELISFTALLHDDNVTLNWLTATEVNNYGFEIERSVEQTLGQSEEWETIGFIPGHGNSNSPKSYKFIDESAPSGNLEYRLKQIDTDGSYEYYGTKAEINNRITDVGDLSTCGQIPEEFSLSQNYPNPFNPTTIINYAIPLLGGDVRGGLVTLKVFDMLGREVATLVNEYQNAGNYKVEFDGSGLSSGIYLYRIKASKLTKTCKMLLVK